MHIKIIHILGDCDNGYDLQEEIDTIATCIQGSLDYIAGQAYSKEVITQQEYELTMDPAAKHSTRCTNKIMQQVRKKIGTKPQTIEDFISVLADMGFSDLALRLSMLSYFITMHGLFTIHPM